MIDTHTHIYMEEFSDGGADALRRALFAGVSHLILPNVDAATVASMKGLHSRFPESTSMAMGLHPTEVGDNWQYVVAEMEREIACGGYVAVGEVGMDLYWDSSRRKLQMDAFLSQLQIAGKYRLPVIIHCREALGETLDVILQAKPEVPLIFHSFTGTPEDVDMIRKVCDPMFGINGVVTFKNAQPLRDALPEIGITRILLETDSPYLAPVPYRGKRNESSYLPAVCRKVAETLCESEKSVDDFTTCNAISAFHLRPYLGPSKNDDIPPGQ